MAVALGWALYYSLCSVIFYVLLYAVGSPEDIKCCKGENIKMSFGTLIHTWINGKVVGKDQFGNRYYRSRQKNRWGREQRWCLFKEGNEASSIPAEWNAWLHHTVAEPLIRASTRTKPWQKSHLPNLTGTENAYRPAGHFAQGDKRMRATGDYEPWSPK